MQNLQKLTFCVSQKEESRIIYFRMTWVWVTDDRTDILGSWDLSRWGKYIKYTLLERPLVDI